MSIKDSVIFVLAWLGIRPDDEYIEEGKTCVNDSFSPNYKKGDYFLRSNCHYYRKLKNGNSLCLYKGVVNTPEINAKVKVCGVRDYDVLVPGDEGYEEAYKIAEAIITKEVKARYDKWHSEMYNDCLKNN